MCISLPSLIPLLQPFHCYARQGKPSHSPSSSWFSGSLHSYFFVVVGISSLTLCLPLVFFSSVGVFLYETCAFSAQVLRGVLGPRRLPVTFSPWRRRATDPPSRCSILGLGMNFLFLDGIYGDLGHHLFGCWENFMWCNLDGTRISLLVVWFEYVAF